jgi:hypothetical protein
VIAVDGSYEAKAEGGALLPVALHGAGAAVEIAAPTAASVAYDPASGMLRVRLPLPAQKGKVEHTLRISGRSDPGKGPAAPRPEPSVPPRRG